jgi:hypothetical protein
MRANTHPDIAFYHDREHDYMSACDMHPKCEVAVQVQPPKRSAIPLVKPMPRAEALTEAIDLITGDRNAQYGPPTQDFQRAAAALNAYGYRRVDHSGENEILPSDIAIIVPLIKISRLMHSRGKRDSWVDLAGYAGCGYECAQEEAK